MHPDGMGWRVDGKELLYLSPGLKMMAVRVRASAASVADTLCELCAAPVIGGISLYDVAADGQRFLLLDLPKLRAGVPR
jgi:hypothetical protein